MGGSESNFVVWWNCANNVRVVVQGVLKGCSSGSIVPIAFILIV